MVTLVLVHGAWGGGWCWRKAATLLREKGLEVYAPTLTGLAERRHMPLETVDLSTHVREIVELLQFENIHDAVLVGHSYAGMIISAVADQQPARVKGLIYFDAFVPEHGQSLFDIAPPQVAQLQMAKAQAFDGGISVQEPSTPRTPPGPGVDEYAPYTPHPIKTMQEKWISVSGKTVWPPRHFILCTANKGSSFQHIAARVKGNPDWTYSEIDAFHDVIYAQSDVTATAIHDALSDMRFTRRV